MKCSNCGKELPAGTGFCAECGTINSLEGGFDVPEAQDAPAERPAQTPDERPAEAAAAPQQPSVAQPTADAPDDTLPPEPEDGDDPFAEMHPDALPPQQDVPEGMPAYVSPTFDDQTIPVPPVEPTAKKPDRNAAFLAAVEAAAADAPTEAMPTEPAAPNNEFTVQLPPEELQTPEPAVDSEATAAYDDETPQVISADDDGDDMYVSEGSGHSGWKVLVALLVLAAVVAGGYYLVRNTGYFKPKKAPASATAANEDASDVSTSEVTGEDDTTEPTSENDSTAPTDEDDTTDPTDEDNTTAPTDKDDTTDPTDEDDTTKPTDEKDTTATTETTAAPTTARPSTTAPTTARPTQATTARPTTTAAPQPTTPTLQQPTTRIAQKTVYITEDGVALRYGPSRSSASRLSLSVGADVVVSGEENGYYYVYSNRYGVSGWVSKSYTAASRPVAQQEQTVSGVVQPDVMTSAENKVVASDGDGLNLRKGPGTSYGIIRSISDGYPVVVKGKSSAAPGWVYVTDTTHGVSGWVSSAFLK